MPLLTDSITDAPTAAPNTIDAVDIVDAEDTVENIDGIDPIGNIETLDTVDGVDAIYTVDTIDTTLFAEWDRASAPARVRPRPAPVEPQQGGAAIKALERGWGGWRLRSATPPLPRGPATKFNLSTRRAPRSRSFSLFSAADPRSPADMPGRPRRVRPPPADDPPCRPPRFPDQPTSRPADRAARAVKI